MTSLAAALDLHRRGLCVIPIPRPGDGHDGKRPVIAWREFQTRRSTMEEIHSWFAAQELNLAVITGAVSGIVVVDLDSTEAWMWARRNLRLPDWGVTTSKGVHLYYRHPGGTIGNRARIETGAGKLAIDVRGDGGYVVGPGSVHASGRVYKPVGDWKIRREQLPVFPTELLERRRPPQTARPPAARPTGELADRARRYLKAIPRPVEGQGSDVLTFRAAARLVRGFGLDEGAALELLREWAPHFDPPWLRRKIASALKYGTEPVGAMR